MLLLGGAVSPCLSGFAVEELLVWDVICSHAVGLLTCLDHSLIETSDLAEVILEWKGVEGRWYQLVPSAAVKPH